MSTKKVLSRPIASDIMVCGSTYESITVSNGTGQLSHVTVQANMPEYLSTVLKIFCNAYPVEVSVRDPNRDVTISFPRAVRSGDNCCDKVIVQVMAFRTDGYGLYSGDERKAQFLSSAIEALRTREDIDVFRKEGKQYLCIK